MKANGNNAENFDLLGKYLAGEMSEVEAVEFITDLENNPNGKLLLEKMQNDWKNIDSYKEGKGINTDRAWSKLFSRLDDEQLIGNEVKAKPNTIIASWTKWAAVALVLVTAGVALFNTILNQDDLIVVQTSGDSSTLIQTLADGSIVYMSSNSQLSYPAHFKGDKREVTLKGEAFFDISRNPEIPFVIETEEMLVEVLGTSFNLKTTGKGDFELMVETGLVKVSSKSDIDQSNFVGAGEKIAMVDNRFVISQNADKNYMGWRTNRMQFKDEKLSVIVQVINRNYSSNILLQTPELGERRMTVTFHDNSLETITELICKTLALKAEAQDSSIIFTAN
jgi:ferric-dicitrate binding protein FerR (iron transport regulator)